MSMEKKPSITQPPVPDYDPAAGLRGTIYRLLAAILRKPDGEHFRYLARDFLDEWDRILEVLDPDASLADGIRQLQSSLRDRDQGALDAEYAALFEPHTKMAAPPYETEYTRETPQHGLLQSMQLADIAGFYRAFGLDISETWPERPDHLATELEFMHILAVKEADAAASRDATHWWLVHDAQHKFLRDHLGRWPAPFLERLKSGTGPDSPYRMAGELIACWIQCDRSLMNIPE